jgi:hypothetical protein
MRLYGSHDRARLKQNLGRYRETMHIIPSLFADIKNAVQDCGARRNHCRLYGCARAYYCNKRWHNALLEAVEDFILCTGLTINSTSHIRPMFHFQHIYHPFLVHEVNPYTQPLSSTRSSLEIQSETKDPSQSCTLSYSSSIDTIQVLIILWVAIKRLDLV